MRVIKRKHSHARSISFRVALSLLTPTVVTSCPPVAHSTHFSVSECRSFCDSSFFCRGFTFASFAEDPFAEAGEAGEAGEARVVRCYWKTAVALTPNAKTNCIAAGGAGKPVCSPLPGEMGLGGYYGHYQGHWLSATAFLYNTTGNATIKTAAAANVATLASVMDAWETSTYVLVVYMYMLATFIVHVVITIYSSTLVCVSRCVLVCATSSNGKVCVDCTKSKLPHKLRVLNT